MGVKITFGLQENHIKRIKECSKHYDNFLEDGDTLEPGWMEYDKYFWEKLGEEFGWEAFTLSLYWFRYKNNKNGNK